jgi:DNA-binding SARP family transcriptional activator
MDFRILGPVEGSSEGTPLQLGGPRQRALLAYLLLHGNETVAQERLLQELWWDPPDGGGATLHTQISRLRKAVGDRLVSTAGGYSLRVGPDELDLDRLRGLLAEAGAAHDPGERARLLRAAESLWHGEPLAGIDLPFVAGERAALDELRMSALEDRLQADVDAGAGAAVIPELSGLIARHPLRERLRILLMLALYRCGRQADALEVARETRRVLDEELGLEPSSELRGLERAILQQDPALAPPARSSPPSPAIASRPRRRGLVAAAALVAVGGASAAAAVLLDRPPAQSAAHGSVVHQRRHVAPALHASGKRPIAPKHAAAKHATQQPQHHAVVVVRHTHVTTTTETTHHVAVKPKHVVTTHQTTTQVTATKPTRTTTAPPELVTLSDDFSGPSMNAAMWSVSNEGTGATAAQENGRLDLTLPATGAVGGQYDMISVDYYSHCRFDGDFDARVDYSLLDWPDKSGARLQLSAWIFRTSTYSDAARSSSSYGGQQYNGDIRSSWNSLPTSDQQGTLRVARKGSVLTSYVEENGNWVPLETGVATGQVTLGLQLFAQNDWSHQAVSGAFSNFTVTGDAPVCR